MSALLILFMFVSTATSLGDPCGFYQPDDDLVCECWPKLEKIMCAGLGLRSLPTFHLPSHHHYRYIDLQDNLLSNLSSKDLQFLQKFEVIKLKDNPIDCVHLPRWTSFDTRCSRITTIVPPVVGSTMNASAASSSTSMSSEERTLIVFVTLLTLSTLLLSLYIIWMKVCKWRQRGNILPLTLNDSESTAFTELTTLTQRETDFEEEDTDQSPSRRGASSPYISFDDHLPSLSMSTITGPVSVSVDVHSVYELDSSDDLSTVIAAPSVHASPVQEITPDLFSTDSSWRDSGNDMDITELATLVSYQSQDSVIVPPPPPASRSSQQSQDSDIVPPTSQSSQQSQDSDIVPPTSQSSHQSQDSVIVPPVSQSIHQSQDSDIVPLTSQSSHQSQDSTIVPSPTSQSSQHSEACASASSQSSHQFEPASFTSQTVVPETDIDRTDSSQMSSPSRQSSFASQTVVPETDMDRTDSSQMSSWKSLSTVPADTDLETSGEEMEGGGYRLRPKPLKSPRKSDFVYY